jgi:GcrA cell cycle regulator
MMPSWPPERVEALRRLWAEGLSAAQVAERLGVTRGAVTGKVARLGLQGRASTARANAIRRGRAPPRPAPGQQGPDTRIHLPGQPLPEPQTEDVATVATLDLEAWHCRWPCGDPVEVGAAQPLFCGRRKVLGLPYCEQHAARAYNRPGTRQLAQDRPELPQVPGAPEKKTAVLEPSRLEAEASELAPS